MTAGGTRRRHPRPALAAATGSAALLGTLLAALLGVAGCSSGSSAPDLSVREPYIPLPAADDVAVGYLTVRNEGGTDDRLVRVTSDLTDDVSMHRTTGSRMGEVAALDVPAEGELRLSRAGNHLMLEGLTRKLRVGDSYEFTLHFARSEPVKVTIPVRPLTYRPPGAQR